MCHINNRLGCQHSQYAFLQAKEKPIQSKKTQHKIHLYKNFSLPRKKENKPIPATPSNSHMIMDLRKLEEGEQEQELVKKKV
jgi:hypothetical protein